MSALTKPEIQEKTFIAEWIASRSEVVTSNAGSLINSLFGDCLEYRGGIAGLGSIVKMCFALGIGETTTRSAIARMALDGALESIHVGRCSDYRRPNGGSPRFDGSMYRAYLPLHDEWVEKYDLVVLHAHCFDAASLAAACAAFTHDGYGRLSDHVFCRPLREPNPYASPEQLLPPELSEAYIQVHGDPAPFTKDRSVQGLLGNMWNFESLRARYLDFVAIHTPLLEKLWDEGEFSAEEAFVVRMYAIHEYRRIVMDSPMLPIGLRARDSACAKARYVIRELYDLLIPKSEEYLNSVLVTSNGSQQGLDPEFFERFGGLTVI